MTFRLGRLMGARGPGLFLVIPIVERMVRVDLRVITSVVILHRIWDATEQNASSVRCL